MLVFNVKGLIELSEPKQALPGKIRAKMLLSYWELSSHIITQYLERINNGKRYESIEVQDVNDDDLFQIGNELQIEFLIEVQIRSAEYIGFQADCEEMLKNDLEELTEVFEQVATETALKEYGLGFTKNVISFEVDEGSDESLDDEDDD